MKKKFFAVALATTMALSTVMTANAETLTGTAWWTGMQAGQDYTLTGDGSITLSVKVTDGEGPAFSVEAYDAGTEAANDGYYVTSGSDGNFWFAELANGEGVNVTKNPFADAGNVAAGSIEVGKTYEVTVTRSGKDFTITYKNEDGSTLYDMAGTSAVDFPETIKVHVMAQVGTFEVSEKTAGETATTTAAAGETTTTTAAAGETTTTKATTAAKTGDVAPVAALAAVAVVACAAVVVSRKKVTE